MTHPAPHRASSRRLPNALSVLLAVFGGAWTLLTILSVVAGSATWTPVGITNLAANAASALLVCAVAFTGTRPRPTGVLRPAQLTAAVAVASVPMLLAAAEGFLARHAQVPSSAQADLLAATLVAVTFVAVCRSAPLRPKASPTR